jgi:hypothetical protein
MVKIFPCGEGEETCLWDQVSSCVGLRREAQDNSFQVLCSDRKNERLPCCFRMESKQQQHSVERLGSCSRVRKDQRGVSIRLSTLKH